VTYNQAVAPGITRPLHATELKLTNPRSFWETSIYSAVPSPRGGIRWA